MILASMSFFMTTFCSKYCMTNLIQIKIYEEASNGAYHSTNQIPINNKNDFRLNT